MTLDWMIRVTTSRMTVRGGKPLQGSREHLCSTAAASRRKAIAVIREGLVIKAREVLARRHLLNSSSICSQLEKGEGAGRCRSPKQGKVVSTIP